MLQVYAGSLHHAKQTFESHPLLVIESWLAAFVSPCAETTAVPQTQAGWLQSNGLQGSASSRTTTHSSCCLLSVSPSSNQGGLLTPHAFWAQVKYDAEARALRTAVERVVTELAVGAGSGPAARRALLPRLPDLAAFLGRK
jgi:hypothetical protein